MQFLRVAQRAAWVGTWPAASQLIEAIYFRWARSGTPDSQALRSGLIRPAIPSLSFSATAYIPMARGMLVQCARAWLRLWRVRSLTRRRQKRANNQQTQPLN